MKTTSQLTKREIEVLLLILDAFSSNKIAENLGISRKTVEAHKRNLFNKFGVNSTLELVKYTMDNKSILIYNGK